MELAEKYKTILSNAGINTPLRLAHFFGQLHHESNLKPKEENLMYSKERLLKVFPKYFNTENVENYMWRPMMIANKIYGDRMGNGPMGSGEGYKFRGRGYIQLTGKDNYKALSDAVGVDFVTNPDKLLTEANSMIAAIWFWTKRNLNAYADKDDVKTITKKINGGYHGLKERTKWVNHYKQEFGYEKDSD